MTIQLAASAVHMRITSRLTQQIGKRTFDLWFQSTSIRCHNGELHVATPNRFVANWIEQHFLDDLSAAAQLELGYAAPITFSIDPSLTPTDDQTLAATEPATPSAQSAASGPRRASGTASATRLRHTLDDFVVGASNELTYRMACQVVDDPSLSISPLFVHGGCGLGKTHLLQGICGRFAQKFGGRRWLYTPAEQFTNRFIQAVRHHTINQFRAELRRVDLLVVDDVHFIAGKTATQQEFLHTFDTIDLSGSKVVIASDCHPKQIVDLCESLKSRFVRGMVVGIDPPDLETRVRIIRGLAQRRGLALLDTVVEAMAGRCDGSIRDIEGVLTRLAAAAALRNGRGGDPIGHAMLNQVLGADEVARPTRPIDIDRIIDVVCERVMVQRADVLGRSRHRRIVLGRSLVCYLARELTTLSYPELGRKLGRSNHSTVVAADQRMRNQIAQRAPLPLTCQVDCTTVDQLVSRTRRALIGEPR